MTKHNLQTTYVWLMLAAHLAVSVFAFCIYAAGGLEFDFFTTALSIVLPIFSVHAATVVSWLLVAEGGVGYVRANEVVGPNLTVLALAVPVLLVSGLVGALYSYAWLHVFQSFEQLKYVMLAIEGLLGGFLGSLMQFLFRPKTTNAGLAEPASANATRQDVAAVP